MNRIQSAAHQLMQEAAKMLQFRHGVSTTSYAARPDVWAQAAAQYAARARQSATASKADPVLYLKRLAVFEHNFALRLLSEFAALVAHGSYMAADDLADYWQAKMVPACQREANRLELMAGQPGLVVDENFAIDTYDAALTSEARETNAAALYTECLLARQLLQQLYYAGYRQADAILALTKQDEDRLQRLLHRELTAELECAYVPAQAQA